MKKIKRSWTYVSTISKPIIEDDIELTDEEMNRITNGLISLIAAHKQLSSLFVH